MDVEMNGIDMATKRPPRIIIQLSEQEMQLLELWAKWHGRPAATYASQILAAQIEANTNNIMSLVDHAAEMKGVERSNLITEWLGDDESNES